MGSMLCDGMSSGHPVISWTIAIESALYGRLNAVALVGGCRRVFCRFGIAGGLLLHGVEAAGFVPRDGASREIPAAVLEGMTLGLPGKRKKSPTSRIQLQMILHEVRPPVGSEASASQRS
jgi:hypothetical protein